MQSKTVALSRENPTNVPGRRIARRGSIQENSESGGSNVHHGRDQPSEQIMDLWWRMGVDGFITFANRGLQETLGYSSEEFLSTAFWEFIHPDDQVLTKEILHRLTIENQVISHDCRFLCHNRTYRRIHWQATYSGPGGFITAIGKNIDSFQNEEQRETLKTRNVVYAPNPILAQEKFLNLIHDINNILSAVLGYTEMASARLSKENPVQEVLQNANAVGQQAKNLVDKCLAPPGQDSRTRKRVDLRSIVEETLVLLRATLPDNIIIQQGEICGSGVVYGDPTKIFQLVMNLCSNAVNVMNSRGGVLSIWIDQDSPIDPPETSSQSDSYVHLSIRDTGPGMTSDTLKRIFEPYFTTHPADKGTGLGLAIVNEIITDLGGLIQVESELGKGSTFHVYFPSSKANKTLNNLEG